MEVSDNHPRLPLLFFVEGSEEADNTLEAMRDAIASLTASRDWTIAPPEFVDETEPAGQPGDLPLRAVGGVLQLYSSFPPWGERLPIELDQAQLEEVEEIIDAMSRFSMDHNVSIIFSLRGEDIGAIDDGVPDESLSRGLIGEWRRMLSARRRT